MHAPGSDQPWMQLFWLLVLALPIACVAWTVTHEEVFREAREFCEKKSQTCRKLIQRKFFYVFTCEFCFSFWVTLLFIVLTDFRLLLDDWRGWIMSEFALMSMANVYMSLFSRLRVDIRRERAEADKTEEEIEKE